MPKSRGRLIERKFSPSAQAELRLLQVVSDMSWADGETVNAALENDTDNF